MHRLQLSGLNHGRAPLAVRERLAFDAAQRLQALAALRQRFGDGSEAVIISTCNRAELYLATSPQSRPQPDQLVEFLSEFHGVPADQFAAHLYHKIGREAVSHLFTVASSLDSMVLGETQILGQVRDAYDAAHAAGATGAILNPLFQRAIAVGKQVMSETPLGEGRLSVASVAVDYARRIFDRFADKTVLNIGAGEMASLVLRHMVELRPGRLLVCNRSPEKAIDLAQEFGGEAVPFERLDDHLVAADIVVTSTGAPEPIITRARFGKLLRPRKYKPIFLIDIALPRDVEASVEDLDHVYLYNLDHLQEVVARTQTLRKDAVDAARAIVAQQVEEFAAWLRTRDLGPVINSLYNRYHQVAREELTRTLNKLPGVGDPERAHLEELARRIVNKLLHDPVSMLRKAGEGHGGPPESYLHALQKIFRLDEPAADPPPAPPKANEEGRPA